MSTIDLLSRLRQLGIRLEVVGDKLRYSPRSAVSPELAAEIKARKPELMEVLRGEREASPRPQAPSDCPTGTTDAQALWQAALDRLVGAPEFPPDVMQMLREADAFWQEADEVQGGEEVEDEFTVIDLPPPCPKCGSRKVWLTLSGKQRCLSCDPPTRSREVTQQVARKKAKASNQSPNPDSQPNRDAGPKDQ